MSFGIVTMTDDIERIKLARLQLIEAQRNLLNIQMLPPEPAEQIQTKRSELIKDAERQVQFALQKVYVREKSLSLSMEAMESRMIKMKHKIESYQLEMESMVKFKAEVLVPFFAPK